MNFNDPATTSTRARSMQSYIFLFQMKQTGGLLHHLPPPPQTEQYLTTLLPLESCLCNDACKWQQVIDSCIVVEIHSHYMYIVAPTQKTYTRALTLSMYKQFIDRQTKSVLCTMQLNARSLLSPFPIFFLLFGGSYGRTWFILLLLLLFLFLCIFFLYSYLYDKMGGASLLPLRSPQMMIFRNSV